MCHRRENHLEAVKAETLYLETLKYLMKFIMNLAPLEVLQRGRRGPNFDGVEIEL